MAEKKKILYIVEAMGGGVFTYIVDLANELVNKYDMYIAYAVRKQTPKNYKDYFDKRIHLIEVKNFGRAINPTKDIAAFFEVKKIAAEVKPDVIHLHSSKAGAIGRVAFNGKIPMFYTPHGYSFLMENADVFLLPSRWEGLPISLLESMYMNRAIGMSDLKSIREVRKQIKKYNPDIIYAHSSKAGAIARVADIGLKNRCVYNPHGWAFNMRCSEKKKKMYAVIEKMAAPFCDKIICISDAEKQSALDKKICKEEKLQVIFNGVDIEAYENGTHGKVKRADLNIPEDAFVVGMVGRISPQKAPDVFVRMAKLVKDEVPNTHFIIVGNGNQEAEIRKYAKDNGFEESLYITGWVDDPMSYVELFDVACLLSRWEGFGLALPEYMMAGNPIVASRVDAIPNIIRDGENGLLVEADDATGASEAVLRIYQDRNLKDKLVAQGLEDVHKKFNARRVSEEHGILFHECGLC